MNLNRHFGNALKKYLEKNGTNKSWLAREMNVTPQSVTSVFNTESPRQDTKRKVLEALKITEEELFGESSEVKEPTPKYGLLTDLSGMVVMSQEEYRILILEKQELQAKLLKYIEKENEELKAERMPGESPKYKTSTLHP